MRQLSAILLGSILVALSGLALSDEVAVELLDAKIASMERLTASLESTGSGWEIRSAMQEHALLMKESIEISESLFYPSPESINHQVRSSSSSTVVDDQHDEKSYRELQLRTLSTLLKHVVIRQNIMMERMGLFK